MCPWQHAVGVVVAPTLLLIHPTFPLSLDLVL